MPPEGALSELLEGEGEGSAEGEAVMTDVMVVTLPSDSVLIIVVLELELGGAGVLEVPGVGVEEGRVGTREEKLLEVVVDLFPR